MKHCVELFEINKNIFLFQKHGEQEGKKILSWGLVPMGRGRI
jgi:hypothetical protein